MIKTTEEQALDNEWNRLKVVIASGAMGIIANRPSLLHVLNKLGPRPICAEIGVNDGSLSELVIKHIKPSKYYLIDPWLHYPDGEKELRSYGYTDEKHGRWFTQEWLDELYAIVVKKFHEDKAVEILRGMSTDMAKLVPDGSLDWAYIDGNHTEEYVYNDCVSWWPKIKSGGVMCGHDFTFPGVPKALERFSGEMNLVVWPYGGDWWIDKD